MQPGLTLEIDNVPGFTSEFNAVVKATIEKESKTESLSIEEIIDFRDIFHEERDGIPKFYRILRQFAPFGPGNMKPIFSTSNVTIFDTPRLLKENHLKMRVFQESDADIKLNAIGFNMPEQFQKLNGKPISIAYHLEENHWNKSFPLTVSIKRY